MNIKQLSFGQYTIIGVLVALVFVASIPQAQAGFFDFLSSNKVNSYVTSNQSYLSQTSQAVSTITVAPKESTYGLIGSNALLASHAPIKETVKYIIKTNGVVVRELIVPMTAYSSTPDQTDDSPFITAWNTQVRDGIVAANFLPFGTKIKIPDVFGNKIFVVEDRMNKRYWHKVDIWFPDRQSALNFGLKTLKIQILES